MDPFALVLLGDDRPVPAPPNAAPDVEPAAAMVNGNGVEGDGSGGSSSASDPATAAQARENKRPRIDDFELDLDLERNFENGRRAHQPKPTAPTAPPARRCFVTVGATAGFRSLLDEVSSAAFLQTLAGRGYVLLDVQCGPDHAAFEERVARLRDEDKHGVSIRAFAYTRDMIEYLIACRGELDVRPAGCVISHGGKFRSHLPCPLAFVATHASSQAPERSARYWASAPH